MKYLKGNAGHLLMGAVVLALAFFGVIDHATAMGVGFALTTTGMLGNGTQVLCSAGSPTGLVAVGNPRDVSFDTGTSAKVDMTNLSSAWKEFLLGLPDPGSLTFTVDYNIADPGQAVLRAARISRVLCDFKVILPAGTTPNAAMQGYVAKFPIEVGGVDQPVKTQVEAYLTGPITLS